MLLLGITAINIQNLLISWSKMRIFLVIVTKIEDSIESGSVYKVRYAGIGNNLLNLHYECCNTGINRAA